MANINIFDTNNIKSTGLTVNGVTVLSGNSSASILTVTGQTGTFMEVVDDPTSNVLWGISGATGAVFNVNTDSINAYVGISQHMIEKKCQEISFHFQDEDDSDKYFFDFY
jgi:hypothetical protein